MTIRPSLWLILVGAFAIRCAAGFSLRRDSSSFFLDTARSLAAGQGHESLSPDSFGTQARAFRPPLYPVLLSLWLRAFGDNRSVIALHAGLGTLVVGLVFLIGREAHSEAAGVLAAALAAAYPYYVFNDTALWDRMPFTLALACAVLSALRGRAAWTGAALALACLVRPSGLFFVPAFAAWLYRFGSPPGRSLALAGAGFAVATAPWIARNGAAFGRPVFVSSAGWELWSANVPAAGGCGYPWVAIDRCIKAYTEAMPGAEYERLKSLGELERDRELESQALAFIRANPGAEARLAWRKLEGLYSPFFNPVLDMDLKPTHGRLERWVHSLWYSAILAGALAGAWSLRRTMPAVALVLYLFLGLTAGSVVFVAHTVHRAPLDFLLMVLAAAWAAQYLGKR